MKRIYIRPQSIQVKKPLPKVRAGGVYNYRLDRTIKKLLLYRMSVLRSYLSDVLTKEAYQNVQYAGREELIQTILAYGLDTDLIEQFKVY